MKSYLSYSMNETIRINSSSGGCCKEIIRYCLENNIANKAITTRLVGLVPETLITDDIDIIMSPNTNSIYQETNPLSVLPEMSQKERYVFVGLPCHIKAVKAYCNKNNIDVITICLFCNCTPVGFEDNILHTLNIDKKDVIDFRYRGNGWPGDVFVVTKNEAKITSYPDAWRKFRNDSYGMMKKCTKCPLIFSYEADICAGDAWIPDVVRSDNKGTNILISMGERGDDILKSSSDDGYISLRNLDNNMVKRIESDYVNMKKKRAKLYK